MLIIIIIIRGPVLTINKNIIIAVYNMLFAVPSFKRVTSFHRLFFSGQIHSSSSDRSSLTCNRFGATLAVFFFLFSFFFDPSENKTTQLITKNYINCVTNKKRHLPFPSSMARKWAW